jgi:hypothetical protein
MDMGRETHLLYRETPAEDTWVEDSGGWNIPYLPDYMNFGDVAKSKFGTSSEDDPPTVTGASGMDFDFASIAKAAVGPGITYFLRGKGALIAIGGGLVAAWAANKFLFGA